MLGVHLRAARLKNKRILFYSDNESVVHVINKQTSKHKGFRRAVGSHVSPRTYILRLDTHRGGTTYKLIVSLACRLRGSCLSREKWIRCPQQSPTFTTRQLRLLEGSLSTLSLKTYQQAWRIFQHFEINVLSRTTSQFPIPTDALVLFVCSDNS